MGEPILVPMVQYIDNKPTENYYLGMYYYESSAIESVEPDENGNTKIFHRSGTSVALRIPPLDFFKYIVLQEQKVNLNFIDNCRRIDKDAVDKITEGMNIRTR